MDDIIFLSGGRDENTIDAFSAGPCMSGDNRIAAGGSIHRFSTERFGQFQTSRIDIHPHDLTAVGSQQLNG